MRLFKLPGTRKSKSVRKVWDQWERGTEEGGGGERGRGREGERVRERRKRRKEWGRKREGERE